MAKRSVTFSNEQSSDHINSELDYDDFRSQYRKELAKTKLELLENPSKLKRKGSFVNDSLSRKILLLQDILYDLPELETNLVNSISGVKHKTKKSLSARIIRLLFGLIFILLIYSFIFVMGLIVSSYLLSPIPLTGSVMTSHMDSNMENDLQKIIMVPPAKDSTTVRVRGSFKVAYTVYNNTPFSGALSVYMNVSYLPQSGTKTDAHKCFGDSVYKYVYKYSYKNVISGELDFFRKTEYKYEDVSGKDDDILKKKRGGSLITVEKVETEAKVEDKSLCVMETTPYNAFLSYPLVGNKIQIIPRISKGFNKVVTLVTLDSEMSLSDSTSMARRMLYDCKTNGYITLKFDSSLQRFDTMLFSGNMLPTNFLPVSVPCSVSSDEEIIDKIADIAKNQRDLYNRQQYILKKLNTSLNM